MNLVNPHLLALLIISLLLFVLVIKRRSRVSKRFVSYAQPHLMRYIYRTHSPFWSGFKLFILILALSAIIFALVRPQWDFQDKDTESSGMDIIFAIDVSKSMDAKDMVPSRLMRAIIQISAFLDQVKTDRIGIIAFAGNATLECPLTDDYEAIRIVLGSLSTDAVTKPGTNVGDALRLAADAFDASSPANTLILISDGEDLAGEAIKQAKQLAAKNVRIHSMGVGSPDGYIITHPKTGQEVLSKLDESSLTEISKVSSGDYYRVTPGGDEIQLILKRIYETEERRISRKRLNILKEQYHLFAALALILLFTESIIDPRSKKGILSPENYHED